MAGGAGNEDLLFIIGIGALRSVNHLETYFAVQHRHPDGERWFDLAYFASRADAQDAMTSAIAAGRAEADALRVRRVTRR